MKKSRDLMGFWKVALGAVFLFNPTVHIVDILPDFIGYWLIALGLTGLAYMSEPICAARKNIIYLAALTAVKAFISLTLPDARSSFTVLCAFVFAVGEAVLFLPAMAGLFDGLSTMGMRQGSNSVFYVPLTRAKAKKVSRIKGKAAGAEAAKRQSLLKKAEKLGAPMSQGGLKMLTAFAFIIRAAGAVIPVLPNLVMYDELHFVTSGQINWSNYSGVFYILCIIAGLWAGIPWLSAFRRYFKGLGKDESFTAAIYAKYEAEVLSDKGLLASVRMKKVMVLCCIAAAFTLQFPIDFVNATPNLITAGLLAGALLYMTAYEKKLCGITIGFAGAWAAVSAVGVWLQSDYTSKNYDPPAAVAFEGTGRGMADELYFRIEIFSYIEAALFLVTALLFAKVFIKVLNSHILLLPERRRVALDKEEKGLEKLLLGVAVSGGVVILFNFALTFVTKYFTGAWIINGAAVIVLFVFTLLSYYRIYDKVYYPLKRKF